MVKMPSKRKRVKQVCDRPKKVGRFTITNANQVTMSTFAICKRIEELKDEFRKRGFYVSCGVQSNSLK